jgi:hypothetical protein
MSKSVGRFQNALFCMNVKNLKIDEIFDCSFLVLSRAENALLLRK